MFTGTLDGLYLDESVRGRETQAVVDARQVSEVEQIVKLGRRRRQILHDRLVELEGHLGQHGHRRLDRLRERLRVSRQDRVVDTVQRRFRRKRHVEHRKEGYEAWIYVVPAAARLTHGCYVVDVLHCFPAEILTPVVAASAIYEQFQHGYRLLGTVRVDGRHIHIIDENNESSTERRPVDVLGPLLDVRLEVPLDVHRVSPAGKVYFQQLEFLAVERVQKVGGRCRFARSTLANQQHLRPSK